MRIPAVVALLTVVGVTPALGQGPCQDFVLSQYRGQDPAYSTGCTYRGLTFDTFVFSTDGGGQSGAGPSAYSVQFRTLADMVQVLWTPIGGNWIIDVDDPASFNWAQAWSYANYFNVSGPSLKTVTITDGAFSLAMTNAGNAGAFYQGYHDPGFHFGSGSFTTAATSITNPMSPSGLNGVETFNWAYAGLQPIDDPTVHGWGSGAVLATKEAAWSATFVVTTPEPATWMMLATGLGLVGLVRWRRKRLG